jgi:hypothetical protein
MILNLLFAKAFPEWDIETTSNKIIRKDKPYSFDIAFYVHIVN